MFSSSDRQKLYYTMDHKNVPLFLDHNFRISWWILTFCATIKTGKILYREITKFAMLPQQSSSRKSFTFPQVFNKKNFLWDSTLGPADTTTTLLLLLLLPFYGSLDFVQDYPGEPVPDRNQSGFTGARDDGWQWHQLDHMQIICT